MATTNYAEVAAKYGLLDEYNRVEQQAQQTKQAYDASNDPDGWDALEDAMNLAQKEQLAFSKRLLEYVTSCEGLKEALLETGIAETAHGQDTAVVKDEMGEFGDKYLLTIQQGEMPPFFSKEFDTPEQVILEMSQVSHPVRWEYVEAE